MIFKGRARYEHPGQQLCKIADDDKQRSIIAPLYGKDRAHDQPEAQSTLEVRLSRCVQPDSLTRAGLCGRFIRAGISVGLRLLMIGIRLDGDGLSVALDQRAAVRADECFVVEP